MSNKIGNVVEKWTIYYEKGSGFRVEQECAHHDYGKLNAHSGGARALMAKEKLITRDEFMQNISKFKSETEAAYQPTHKLKGKELELDKKDTELVNRQIEMFNTRLMKEKSVSLVFSEDIKFQPKVDWPTCAENIRLMSRSKKSLDYEEIKRNYERKLVEYENTLKEIEMENMEKRKRTRFSNFASITRDRFEKAENIRFNKTKKPKKLKKSQPEENTETNKNTEYQTNDSSSDDDEDEYAKEFASCVVTYDSIIEFAKEAKQRAEKRYLEELKDGLPLYDL
ncbi:hypothetical protein FDP41_000338 [Naegleria fowleri]|uniref:Uncharacterized protein n=1 Tax=Naegleria fowleri TaxID=5763 RepID=A0A6A5CGK8_NAEFO|nr:uncharacterized protein FDP41_000338 [Naegleria fowleri]KAF0984439.1 hypothetical protein FDP41_000338 [Naegleria fowleri]CAG4718724.1 unnamed protein product [Naegleria fowleri]